MVWLVGNEVIKDFITKEAVLLMHDYIAFIIISDSFFAWVCMVTCVNMLNKNSLAVKEVRGQSEATTTKNSDIRQARPRSEHFFKNLST